MFAARGLSTTAGGLKPGLSPVLPLESDWRSDNKIPIFHKMINIFWNLPKQNLVFPWTNMARLHTTFTLTLIPAWIGTVQR